MTTQLATERFAAFVRSRVQLRPIASTPTSVSTAGYASRNVQQSLSSRMPRAAWKNSSISMPLIPPNGPTSHGRSRTRRRPKKFSSVQQRLICQGGKGARINRVLGWSFRCVNSPFSSFSPPPPRRQLPRVKTVMGPTAAAAPTPPGMPTARNGPSIPGAGSVVRRPSRQAMPGVGNPTAAAMKALPLLARMTATSTVEIRIEARAVMQT